MNRREFLTVAAAAPFAVRAPLALGAEAPLALVTADLESRIAVVDPLSGRLIRFVATPPGPRSIERIGDRRAVVAHTSSGRLSVVDARRVRHVVGGFAEPRYTAAHLDGELAYVTDSGAHDLAVVDVTRARVLQRIELGGPARHVSLSRDGRTLWVSLGSKAERIAILDLTDARRPRVSTRITPPFLAHDVGFEPRGRRVWVTSGDMGAVVVYDARSGRRVWWTRADAPPQHVAFADGVVFVSSGGAGTVRTYALGGRLLRTTRVPAGSYNVQHAWRRVVTPSLAAGTVCVLNERGVLLHREQVARSSHDACFVRG